MPTGLSPIDPELRIGSVELAVSDLSRSTDFYERVLGLPLISREQDGALLGLDREHPLLALTQLTDPTPVPPGSTGLFHVAWLHPTRAAWPTTVRRVWPAAALRRRRRSRRIRGSVSERPRRPGHRDLRRPPARAAGSRPPDGHGVKMVTLALDLDSLLAESAEASATMGADTAIGHVHLKVSDVPRAVVFYRDVLGLDEQARLPSAGFLSAGGYHHHIGLNSWQSQGGRAAPDSAPGLRQVEFELSDTGALEALERRLAETGAEVDGDSSPAPENDKRLSLRDPDGHALTLRSLESR